MTSKFRPFWAVLLITVLLVAGLAVLPGRGQAPAYAQVAETPGPNNGAMTRSVTVSGQGTANVTPDIAFVDLGVQTDAKTAADALAQNNKQMQAVMNTLTGAGIAAADIKTQTIQVYPRYENPTPTVAAPQGQAAATTTPNQPTGFTATNTVEVTVRNLANLGTLLDQVVTAGGNTIQGVRFDVSDQTKAMDQARTSAMADANHKAQQLATLANAKLGAVITIVENSQGPIPYQPMAARAAAESVPVSPGSQAITITVQVTWELQ